VAFVVRLAGVGLGLALFPNWLIPNDTASSNLPIARSLAAGKGYQMGDDSESAFRAATRLPPVLPCWLALVVCLAGDDPPLWLLGVGNAAFRAGAVVLVYLLARRCFGHRAALFGAGLYLLDPWEWFWVGYVMKEPLAVPLFLLAVWLVARCAEWLTPGRALAAGAAIGLATLARFANLALAVAAGLVLATALFRARRGRWEWVGRAAGLFACLLAGLLVVLSPWLIRNWRLFGQPIFSPNYAGQYFYTSNGPGIEMVRSGYYSPQGIDPTFLKGVTAPPWEVEGHYFTKTLHHLGQHPGEAVRRLGVKLVNMWQPTFAGSSVGNWLALGLPYVAGMAVCLFGVALAVGGRKRGLVLLAPVLVLVGVHLVYWGEIRNRQYLTPLLFAFGGLALSKVQGRGQKSEVRSQKSEVRGQKSPALSDF
jgi:4-amino-4-deoxy-L-arabinose transferase-like glycosyltransferase